VWYYIVYAQTGRGIGNERKPNLCGEILTSYICKRPRVI